LFGSNAFDKHLVGVGSVDPKMAAQAN